MKEAEFKVLMHSGYYVDVNLLHKGIYASNKPFMYSKNDTIESVIQNHRIVIKQLQMVSFHESYFDNLKQCELVPVLLTEKQ